MEHKVVDPGNHQSTSRKHELDQEVATLRSGGGHEVYVSRGARLSCSCSTTDHRLPDSVCTTWVAEELRCSAVAACIRRARAFVSFQLIGCAMTSDASGCAFSGAPVAAYTSAIPASTTIMIPSAPYFCAFVSASYRYSRASSGRWNASAARASPANA